MSHKLSRAQVLTGSTRRTEFFSDFLTSFAKTPVGNDLARVTNERSVNQLLRNIILTEVGEGLFQPTRGSNVRNSLFENNFVENLTTMEFYIQNAVENYVPMVNLLGVTIDSIGDHDLEITINYNLINNPENLAFTFLLKRVR